MGYEVGSLRSLSARVGDVVEFIHEMVKGPTRLVIDDKAHGYWFLRHVMLDGRAVRRDGHVVMSESDPSQFRLVSRGTDAADWQPIKGAPKNETVLLCIGGKVLAGHYKLEWGAWQAEFCHDDHGALPEPTHWQPLPAPPTT